MTGRAARAHRGGSDSVRLTTRLASFSLAALASISACADVLDIAENPVLVPPDSFTCKDGANSPSPMPDNAVVRVRACDFISSNCSTPARGLTAKLCDKKDFPCEKPRIAELKDVDGELMFEVPTGGTLGSGFDGYLAVLGPLEQCGDKMNVAGLDACQLAPKCDMAKRMAQDKDCLIPTYIPALLFFNPPITADTSPPIVLPLIPSIAGQNLLAGAAGGATVDPSQGIVFATGLDCFGHPSAGMTFTSSPAAGRVIYIESGLVNPTAVATDRSGVAGLLGLPMGFAWVSAFTPGQMGAREVAKTGIQIMPATVSYVALAPTAN
jgi:hypothetical protein